MNRKWFFVDTEKKRQRAIDDFSSSPLLSIDTEYDSFRYFREKLCLIQIKAAAAAYIFDPLSGVDLSFLGKYFKNKKITKVLHAADNDIRLLKRDYGFDFENIFDTHRAAMLLGFQELSLDKMINRFLGLELKKNKKMQRSRWDERPLSDEQIMYAVEDVAHLPALYDKQLSSLRENRLENAAAEAFARIAASHWQEKKIDWRGHTKIAGYHELDSRQKELLRQLYAWRFARAKEENRAIFMFMPDKVLFALAQNSKDTEGILAAARIKHFLPELTLLIKGQKNQSLQC